MAGCLPAARRSRGKPQIDTMSLMGFTSLVKFAAASCGVSEEVELFLGKCCKIFFGIQYIKRRVKLSPLDVVAKKFVCNTILHFGIGKRWEINPY